MSDMGVPSAVRVPLDRKPNPDGIGLNEGTNHLDVPVVIEPDLPTWGEYGYTYDYSRVIRLREWNEQVLLHEILHVVLDPLTLGTPDDPHGHNVVSRVEVALWETGWRLRTPPRQSPSDGDPVHSPVATLTHGAEQPIEQIDAEVAA